jgi:hypothetical protein
LLILLLLPAEYNLKFSYHRHVCNCSPLNRIPYLICRQIYYVTTKFHIFSSNDPLAIVVKLKDK